MHHLAGSQQPLANFSTVMQSIGGMAMHATVVPSTVDELRSCIADCAARDMSVFPLGGGVAMDVGMTPSRAGTIVDLTRLNRIIDYPAEDMTVTVEAGIRLADLEAELERHGQSLPLDASLPKRATLGGVLATRWQGPRSYGYGSPRDFVLGIEVIDAKARRIQGGGRVVKNVAGYDLMKLHIGAYGTLGVISRATLKLKPVPEARSAVVFALDIDVVEPALSALNRSKTRPVGIEIVSQKSALAMPCLAPSAKAAWTLVVLFEECREAVAWQMDTVASELAGRGGHRHFRIHDVDYEPLLSGLRDWPEFANHQPLIMAKMLPSAVAGFCRTIGALSNVESDDVLIHAGCGTAFVRGTVDADSANLVNALSKDDTGSISVIRGDDALKSRLLNVGERTDSWPLMRRLKASLDPTCLFNPGRLSIE